MKYYIIAGEASGDLHGANLIKEIKNCDKDAQFRVWGGDLMQEQGAELVKHYRDHAFMGITVVIKNLKTIKANFRFCEKDIIEYKPDVVIHIDYSGFNLRIAEFLRKNTQIPVYYYIAPQVWAWRQWRVKKIRRLVHKLFVIQPFEQEFYEKHNMKVDFVGHPLLDAIEQKSKSYGTFQEFTSQNNLSEKPIIALLPGSRKHEIEAILPLLLKVTSQYKDYQLVIAGAPSFTKDYYAKFCEGYDVKVLFGKTYEILKNAYTATVASGTASLETALFHVPQVVCFKTDLFTAIIVKVLIRVKFVSLANLIMGKEIFKEILQWDFTEANLKQEMENLLNNKEYRKQMINNYLEMEKRLGGIGASKRAAQKITGYLMGKT